MVRRWSLVTTFVAMADNLSKEVRSCIMSRIRSKDTKPELLVRSFLHRAGYRFRLHRRDLPGRPDIVLPKFNVAIMVHGCFWHAHQGCSIFRMPTTRTAWWKAKLHRNRRRDKRAVRMLGRAGWTPVTIWECELQPDTLAATLKRLRKALREGGTAR